MGVAITTRTAHPVRMRRERTRFLDCEQYRRRFPLPRQALQEDRDFFGPREFR